MKSSLHKYAAVTIVCVAGFATSAQAAEHVPQAKMEAAGAYSPAVITEGGRVVWMAGQIAVKDLNGKDIANDFEAQARTVFAKMDQTLHKAGGSLKDIVTMTVFVTDSSNRGKFLAIRRGTFAADNYPASALITISNLAFNALIEIQAVAVIGDHCKSGPSCGSGSK